MLTRMDIPNPGGQNHALFGEAAPTNVHEAMTHGRLVVESTIMVTSCVDINPTSADPLGSKK